jgi:hypothetical protein
MNCHHLIRLGEGWRSKAAGIRHRYGQANPNLVEHVVAALETCAQELEDEVRAALAVAEVPSVKLQVESAKPANVQPST